MSILSGYKKFKKYIKTSSGFQLQSLWSNANTVEADDGKNMETKVGAINGITSSTTANSTDIAASANLVNTRCNELSNNLETTNNKLGGCSFEQNGNAFYVVGADSVRKKLGDQEFAALDCGGVAWTAGEFGQWHHGYHFTKVSEIPNFGSMIHGKDFFIEVYNGGTEQLNAGIGVSYVKHSDSELVMTSVNLLSGFYRFGILQCES